MICPRCSSKQSDEIKFCTSCGANLQAVREALEAPESGSRFDWGDTWVAEMFMSGKANELRKKEMERRLGITPEVKRYNEIKAGVILSCIGIGVSIFLAAIMEAIALGVPGEEAELLRRIWVAGIIPFLIGVALIINGLVVSKRIVKALEREEKGIKEMEEAQSPRGLRSPNTSEFIPANMSVTDQTTRHLDHSERTKYE